MKYYLSFDLGGTNLKYGVINDQGKIYEKGITPTPKECLGQFVDIVVKITEQFVARYEIESIALSCPGSVNNETGIIGGTSALPYIHGPNIKDLISRRTNLNVYLQMMQIVLPLLKYGKVLQRNVKMYCL